MGDADKALAQIIDLAVPAAVVRGHRSGTIVQLDEGRLLVDYPNNPHGPIEAQSTLVLDQGAAERAVQEGRRVLLAFVEERSDQPVIVGLLQDPIQPADATRESGQSGAVGGFAASLDGRRVVLEAHDEVVLRCGDASITLRRNGRLLIRGVFVETRARGVNRIKGGSVQIN